MLTQVSASASARHPYMGETALAVLSAQLVQEVSHAAYTLQRRISMAKAPGAGYA